MSTSSQTDNEYIYVTIPADYLNVYHCILTMLADYGEDMLKDCKASCSSRNSGVIECFNMFNAAVAARELGNTKLAETLIKYIKAKVRQIYGRNCIVDINISATFSPTSAKAGIENTITISLTLSNEASAIELWRGDVKIGETSSGRQAIFEDTVTPNTTDDIIYTVKATANGAQVTKSFNLSVEKRTPILSWSKSTDTVNIKDAQTHKYPTLNNPNGLSVVYSSSNTNVATINASTGVITLKNVAGTTTIKAVFSGNDTFTAKTVQYTLTVLTVADYYVGWATGENSGFNAFTSLSTEQLLAISTDYSKLTNPTFTKTISASEAIGASQIFFIMWRDESAPKSGSITSGGITETLQAADFTDTDVFRATHSNIIVDDVTYHVSGLRGAFDARDTFTINF